MISDWLPFDAEPAKKRSNRSSKSPISMRVWHFRCVSAGSLCSPDAFTFHLVEETATAVADRSSRMAGANETRNLLYNSRECIIADVVALVIGGFGLAVLAIVVSSLQEAAAMKRWPVAQGRVLSAKVEKYRESVSRGTGGPRDRMTLYRPVLVYEYEVAGKRFRGSRIAQSPGLNRGVPEFAEKVVKRYRAGSAVMVRYNPRRPDESVLEPRVPGSWIFGAAIGVALLVLAVYTYLRGR
jgi:hypothetical protein